MTRPLLVPHSLLLFKFVLDQELFHFGLIFVENTQAVLHALLSPQLWHFPEKFLDLCSIHELHLEWCNTDTLQTLLKALERLGEGKEHQYALESFEQVL